MSDVGAISNVLQEFEDFSNASMMADDMSDRHVAGNANGHGDLLPRIKYKRRIGTCSRKERKEYEYDINLYIWFIICALKNKCIHSFSLASDLYGVGIFNNIVIKYICSDNVMSKPMVRRCFVHTNVNYGKKCKISESHFSTTGNFSSTKLYSSFSDIKQNYLSSANQEIFGGIEFDDSFFILTNVDVDQISDDSVLKKSEAKCMLSKDINTGSIFSICKPNFYYENDIQIFSSQANLDDMKYNIIKGIAEICKCSEDLADLICLDFYKMLHLCYQSSYILTKEDALELLHNSKETVFSENELLNYRSNESIPVIDEETQKYMQEAVKTSLTTNELRSLTNFRSAENSNELCTFNYDGKVCRPSQMLISYYTALWFTHNYHRNRNFLMRNLFTLKFCAIKQKFDEILTCGFDLHSAVLRNNINEVKYLLGSGINVNLQDKAGRTPLHLITSEGDKANQDIMSLLIEHGANIHIVDKVFHWTALQYADTTQCWHSIGLLLKHGGSLNDLVLTSQTISYNGNEALHSALKVGSERFVHFLVEKGTNVNEALTDTGETPIHIAAVNGDPRIVEFLVKNGANYDVPDSEMRTPLYLAYFNNNESVVQYLLSEGAVSLTI